MNNTALQVTNFDFYGDNLIAIQDNATGEIYAAINHVLRGIGFSDKQIEHQQKKIINDEIFKFHTQKFSGVDLNMPSVNNVWCISNRKLPLALAKIHITPKMKSEQPDMADRLIRYQDKCADVLASVFIDHKQPDQNYQPFLDTLTTLSNSLSSLQQDISDLKQQQSSIQHQLSKKIYSPWGMKMYPKYKLLTEHFDVSYKELYRNLYLELENTYPDVDLNQEVEDYCYANNLEEAYTLDVIEHTKSLRKLFTALVDSLLEKYNLTKELESTNVIKRRTIFDDIPIQRKTVILDGE